MKRLILTLPAALLAASLAQAQQPARVQGFECGVEREVPAGALTQSTYSRLERIYEMIGEENYAEAYPELESLLERTERDDYEQAIVLQAMGHVRYTQDRPLEALAHFQRAVELNSMPNAQQFEMIMLIANIYYQLDRFQDALDQLDLWFCVTPPDQTNVAEVWVMKASLHAQKDEFQQSLDAIDRAISLSDEPKEQWYQLKLAMHLELNEYAEGIDTLKILIPMSPETKNYWLQMAALYMELNNEEQSKATLALAYRRGLLDRQSEFMQLASLLQMQDSPRQAAEVMEDGLARGIIEGTRRNWEMVGGAWYEARELDKALTAYEQAGGMAEDGKIDVQRGFLLIDLERWEEARDALSRAIQLGGLSESDEGNAHLLLGMAYMNLDDFEAAERAFNEATNYSRVRQAAREWLNHMREERGRRSGR
ncbi:tetratricopeptide repeat protein [Wenzhouxiangella marina]|uniref:Uncharacterized protein n=1 Tax=Wenzhouxiangella marina TaxID=1579979 RepID=A0A0K0XT42_9GAMM|nr:tetratricopeptide repeat protein [Wenzhouxiangella marina]AKS40858.1 hypothetical protein WM2015_476 [Wenzhouxiangella marina]MBB6087732.1 tetratricopeptide (TPR) repeat protein [Wenzhouxiangella marina]